MSSMGIKINQFDVPVCNSFQAKILNDQLCYEVDLNEFTSKDNIDHDLKLGLYLILDYNEDRQITFGKNVSEKRDVGLANSITELDDNKNALIYLNTIGKFRQVGLFWGWSSVVFALCLLKEREVKKRKEWPIVIL